MVEYLKVLNSRVPKGPMVEHLKVLMVEHLKVMAALTVEPAYASSPLPYGRAPKGPYQSSTSPLLSLMVEHLKVLISRAP
jgi:hypothetical protein